MVKRELIAMLARRHGEIKVKDVDLMVRLIFDSMSQAMVDGSDIELRGFGSFRLRTYSPREARNPGSGRKVRLDARRGVLFRPGLEMRERINAG